MVVDADAALLELGVENLRDQRRAAAAGGAGLGLALERADRGAAGFDGRAQAALGHVVAGADLCGFRQRGQRVGRGCTRKAARRRKQHAFRVLRQRHGVQHRSGATASSQRCRRPARRRAASCPRHRRPASCRPRGAGRRRNTRARPCVVACASPMEPTSTPSSLSLVLMSAPAKTSLGTPSTRAAAMRAIW